jgi:hypothetical protein
MLKDFEALKAISREVEAFDYESEAFIKLSIPFEDIFRERNFINVELLCRDVRLL